MLMTVAPQINVVFKQDLQELIQNKKNSFPFVVSGTTQFGIIQGVVEIINWLFKIFGWMSFGSLLSLLVLFNFVKFMLLVVLFFQLNFFFKKKEQKLKCFMQDFSMKKFRASCTLHFAFQFIWRYMKTKMSATMLVAVGVAGLAIAYAMRKKFNA